MSAPAARPATRLPIRVHFGAPGCGKSHQLKLLLRSRTLPRVFIWDPQAEYGAFGANVDRLSIVIDRSKAPAFSIVYRPSSDLVIAKKQFSAFCKIAYARGRCLVLVDELADVTLPAWSPPGWGMVIRKGRHQHMEVFAAAPRPTEVDSRIFSVATVIRTGRLNGKSDRVKLADVMGIDRAEIADLGMRSWIERDMITGRITRSDRAARVGARGVTAVTDQAEAHPGPSHDVTPPRPASAGASRSVKRIVAKAALPR
jgi:hypothetical protein